jgi:8-oxo-dGTP diphosphatase
MKETAIAAGAIVLRDIGGELKIALAHDSIRDLWVLPKGHVDPGEPLEQAALREVREEVGLEDVQLIKYLGKIVRPSMEKGVKEVQKSIHLYLAYALGNEPFKTRTDLVSTEEVFSEACWFSLEQAIEVVPYKEDRTFLEEHLALLLS